MKMGSVKDLVLLEPAYENKWGSANFDFSDRYSIFDWGEMPDHIERKGAALAVMSAFNFEELERVGIKTHYKGLVTKNHNLIRFSDLTENGNGLDVMRVSFSKKYDPIAREFIGEDGNPIVKYDYSFYDTNRGKINNYLIPLEIIFRNDLPLGSSVFKKIAKAKELPVKNKRQKKLNDIYNKLGLSGEPNPGDMLPKPVLHYTTKLEAGDRNLTEDEAYRISGLTEQDFEKVAPLALDVDKMITEMAMKAGMDHYDGKVEMVYHDGLCLVDVIGTLDENRLGLDNEQVSKEFIRQWYKKNQPDFAPACDEWKKTGEGWQDRCTVKPVHIPEELATLVSQMYMAASNLYTGKRVFNVPELAEIMEQVRPYRG
jgi:phosphoribosylaminoimidazole-succinocarboxamide synthase